MELSDCSWRLDFIWIYLRFLLYCLLDGTWFLFLASLNKFGFSCSFGNNKVSLCQNSNMVDFGSLIDNLYMLHVVSSYNEILQMSAHGTKQKLNENSTTLWHKCLGHISKHRIQRLVLDDSLRFIKLWGLCWMHKWKMNSHEKIRCRKS